MVQVAAAQLWVVDRLVRVVVPGLRERRDVVQVPKCKWVERVLARARELVVLGSELEWTVAQTVCTHKSEQHLLYIGWAEVLVPVPKLLVQQVVVRALSNK